jgi:hypothetical protein
MDSNHDTETFGSGPDARILVRPRESDEILINPAMGFQTYQRFNGDPIEKKDFWNDDGPTSYSADPPSLKNEDFPDASVAYLRWYWYAIEPEEGRYRWDIIDRALETAKRRGQQLHIRVMPHDHLANLPAWYVQKGRVFRCKLKSADCVFPDYDDPLFRSATEKLVSALGARYDGHPGMAFVDIGTLGFWGEWHLEGTAREKHLFYTDVEHWPWAVDIYFQSFKKTPLIGLIGCVPALRHATAHGAGWRADCWGDFSQMRHMRVVYPRNITQAGVHDAWRRGAVLMETCWTYKHWHEKSWPVDYFHDEAARWHTSLINAKSSVIPKDWQPAVAEFQKRIGYRFVLRSVERPAQAHPGAPFRLTHWWVNRGVAPCYHEYRIAARLEGAGRDIIIELPHDLRTWMPGEDRYLMDDVALPSDAPSGKYRLSLGIVRRGEKKPFVKMANEGRTKEGWMEMGEIDIKE